eukprot:gene81-81_t
MESDFSALEKKLLERSAKRETEPVDVSPKSGSVAAKKNVVKPVSQAVKKAEVPKKAEVVQPAKVVPVQKVEQVKKADIASNSKGTSVPEPKIVKESIKVAPKESVVSKTIIVDPTPVPPISAGEYLGGISLGLAPFIVLPALVIPRVLALFKPPKPLPVPPPPKVQPYSKPLGEGISEGLKEFLSDKRPADITKGIKLSAIGFGSSLVFLVGSIGLSQKPTEAPVTPAPVVKTEKKTAPAPVKKVEPAPALKVEPAPAPKVEPAPAPKIEPAPAPKVEPAPAPKVEPAPAPKVEPAPAPKVEPAPAPKVEPAPAPKVEPAPAPKVEPAPAPTPAPKVEPAPKEQPVEVLQVKPTASTESVNLDAIKSLSTISAEKAKTTSTARSELPTQARDIHGSSRRDEPHNRDVLDWEWPEKCARGRVCIQNQPTPVTEPNGTRNKKTTRSATVLMDWLHLTLDLLSQPIPPERTIGARRDMPRPLSSGAALPQGGRKRKQLTSGGKDHRNAVADMPRPLSSGAALPQGGRKRKHLTSGGKDQRNAVADIQNTT